MSEVLLLCPRPDRPFHSKYLSLSPPLGLGYLAKSLKDHCVTVRIIDLYSLPLGKQELINLIQTEKPKLVGFLVYTESVSATIQICSIIKEINKEITTVVGGPHATFACDELIQHSAVDLAVKHEGEEAIIEIWEEIHKEKQDFSKIKGICYQHNSYIYHTEKRKPIEELDLLGFPLREWFPNIKKYLAPATIISSRGCPGNCTFCGGANISGGSYRRRHIASIAEEVEYLQGIFPKDNIIFWDDAFGYDTQRLADICHLFIEKDLPTWSCGIRVDRVTPEILQMMKQARCSKINFGVESGSQEILNQIQKGISLDQIRNAIKWAKEADIYNSCSIVIGHPNDTHTTVQQTLTFAKELLNNGATSCTFNALIPFPGTYVYERKDNLNIKFRTKEWKYYNFLDPVFENEHLTIYDIRKYLIQGLNLWATYKSNRDKYSARLKVRDAILLGDFLGRKVQTC